MVPETKDEVRVKVFNYETGHVYMWNIDTFKDKLAMMRDAMNYEVKEKE